MFCSWTFGHLVNYLRYFNFSPVSHSKCNSSFYFTEGMIAIYRLAHYKMALFKKVISHVFAMAVWSLRILVQISVLLVLWLFLNCVIT